MHTYSINGKERTNVLGSIGILSMVIIWSIHHYLPDGVPVPSVFVLFGTLVLTFDKWLWRWMLFQKIFVKTPDLNGNWVVSSQSSIIHPEKVYNASLTIKQTWTHIHIFFDGEKSSSESVMAGIEIKTDDMFFLKWEYRAEYKPTFADDPNNKIHYGMTKLLLKPVSTLDAMGGK